MFTSDMQSVAMLCVHVIYVHTCVHVLWSLYIRMYIYVYIYMGALSLISMIVQYI